MTESSRPTNAELIEGARKFLYTIPPALRPSVFSGDPNGEYETWDDLVGEYREEDDPYR